MKFCLSDDGDFSVVIGSYEYSDYLFYIYLYNFGFKIDDVFRDSNDNIIFYYSLPNNILVRDFYEEELVLLKINKNLFKQL